jgi:hypothetical protein
MSASIGLVSLEADGLESPRSEFLDEVLDSLDGLLKSGAATADVTHNVRVTATDALITIGSRACQGDLILIVATSAV